MFMRFLVDNRVVVDFDLSALLVEEIVVVGAVGSIDVARLIIKAQWCMTIWIWLCFGFALPRKWFSLGF